MAWIPAQDVGGDDRQRSDELRIRASNLALSGPSGLQPFVDKLAPLWANSGEPRSLAQNQFAGSRYPAGDGENAFLRRSGAIPAWKQRKLPCRGSRALLRQFEWQRWSTGITRSYGEGADAVCRRLPRAVDSRRRSHAQLGENDKGFMLDGRDIDVQATGVRRPRRLPLSATAGGRSWLGILVGISTNDGAAVHGVIISRKIWMGKALVDYLSGAIAKWGKPAMRRWCMAAIRIYSLYPHNEVSVPCFYVPLKNATSLPSNRTGRRQPG